MNMHDYLETVSEQIRCRRARPMIIEELQAHIEDQKIDYMAEGMPAKEAEEEAVRQMGDPVETGLELDRVHRPKLDWGLLCVILLLSATGMILQWMTYQQPDSAYKIAQIWEQAKYMGIGFVLMLGICLADYTVIGKHAFRLWQGAIVLNIFCRCMVWIDGGGFLMGVVNGGWTAPWFWGSFILPAFAAVVWKSGKKGKKGLAECMGCLAISAVVWLFFSGSGFVCAVYTVIGFAVVLVAVAKGWFGKENRKIFLRLCAAAAAAAVLICAIGFGSAALAPKNRYRADRIETWQNFSQTTYAKEVRANVKELAASDRAGEDLTGTELEWTRFDVRSTFMWIYMLRYLGTFPVILLTLLAGVFLVLLFRIIFRQRNRLGLLLALSGALFFALQIIWYVGMNTGLLPVTAAYMPFCTQGGANLCVTYIYAGILLSVYRNSSVVRN